MKEKYQSVIKMILYYQTVACSLETPAKERERNFDEEGRPKRDVTRKVGLY